MIPYHPDKSSAFYKDYYRQQIGHGLSVFSGATTQRGHGIGGFFSSLLKGAMPLLKSGAKNIGRELLSTGVNVAKDLLNGEQPKKALKRRFASSGVSLLDKLDKSLNGPSVGSVQPKKRRVVKKVKKHKKKGLSRTVDILSLPYKG